MSPTAVKGKTKALKAKKGKSLAVKRPQTSKETTAKQKTERSMVETK